MDAVDHARAYGISANSRVIHIVPLDATLGNRPHDVPGASVATAVESDAVNNRRVNEVVTHDTISTAQSDTVALAIIDDIAVSEKMISRSRAAKIDLSPDGHSVVAADKAVGNSAIGHVIGELNTVCVTVGNCA